MAFARVGDEIAAKMMITLRPMVVEKKERAMFDAYKMGMAIMAMITTKVMTSISLI